MTPEESKDYIDGLVTATAAAVGGEWDISRLAARECFFGDDEVGVYFAYAATSKPGADDLQAVSATVLDLWRSQYGLDDAEVYDSPVGDVPGIGVRVPTRDDLFGIRFDATEHALTMNGTSSCTPGDAEQINRDRDSK